MSSAGCCHGAVEDCRWSAAPDAVAMMGSLEVIELHVVVPALRQAGWSVERVLTDGGGEFKAEFAAACAALGIRHTRIKPRHAWTNGFVERLQQTILTEHWRVVFRRHYFTSRATLDHSLHRFMQFYNFERPHHGYRVRGRTPATIFRGAMAAAR